MDQRSKNFMKLNTNLKSIINLNGLIMNYCTLLGSSGVTCSTETFSRQPHGSRQDIQKT